MLGIGRIRTYNGLYSRIVIAIYDILFGKEVRCRNGHRTNLVQSQHADPKFIAALQDEHYHIALADAKAGKKVCALIGKHPEILKCEAPLLSFHIRPEHGHFIRLFLCQHIHHIIGEIKVFRRVDAKVFLKILIVLIVAFCVFLKDSRHISALLYLEIIAKNRQVFPPSACMAWGYLELK